MEVFDGKKAAQDYMSKHTLAFSTPELTLMRFAFWLGDSVPDPKKDGNAVPRMMTFLTEQATLISFVSFTIFYRLGKDRTEH